MNNFDQNELDKFSKLADEWWDPNGKFKPLHLINPLRSEYISKKINLEGLDVLDICLLYTSPSPRDGLLSRMPSSA